MKPEPNNSKSAREEWEMRVVFTSCKNGRERGITFLFKEITSIYIARWKQLLLKCTALTVSILRPNSQTNQTGRFTKHARGVERNSQKKPVG